MWMLHLLQQQQRWEVHSRRDALAAQSICLSTSAAVPLLGCPATITWLQRSRAATTGGEAFNEVNLQLLLLDKAGMGQGEEPGAAVTAERGIPNPQEQKARQRF